jgi:hypothetical protein
MRRGAIFVLPILLGSCSDSTAPSQPQITAKDTEAVISKEAHNIKEAADEAAKLVEADAAAEVVAGKAKN